MIKFMTNYITLSLNRILGIEKTEKEISLIKKNTINQMASITKILKKRGIMQRKLFKKTSTYFIAKEVGVL